MSPKKKKHVKNLAKEFTESEQKSKQKFQTSASKSLITPEKHKESWKSKKDLQQVRKKKEHRINSMPLIKWGGDLTVNNVTYSFGNTCPIGEINYFHYLYIQ
jgi:hypothetical protein